MRTMSNGLPGFVPQEKLLGGVSSRNCIRIGLPCEVYGCEKRVSLTPEGVAMLVEAGHRVYIESGVGSGVSYTDVHYTEAGAVVASREDVYRCDIILKINPLDLNEAQLIRPGAILFSLFRPQYQKGAVVRELMARKVMAVAVDRIVDGQGRCPFADLLSETDGQAAVVVAADLLSNRSGGKGVLLGGVSGVPSCEVVIIGGGRTGCSAARLAHAMGAFVRVFDTDFYRLQDARESVGLALFTSNMHPNVLRNALRSADVVIGTEVFGGNVLTGESVALMKRGALLFDLCMDRGGCFEGSRCGDEPCDCVYEDRGVRFFCLSSVGSAVARTASMALSNLFVPFILGMGELNNLSVVMKGNDSLRHGLYLYGGYSFDKDLCRRFSLPYYDLGLYLSAF